jgi:hypothetical protein
MELENIILSEVSQFRKLKSTCFLSYVEYRPNTNLSNVTYTYRYIQNMYPQVGVIEETKGGGRKDSE